MYHMLEDTNLNVRIQTEADKEVELNGCTGIYYQADTEEHSNTLAWADEEAGILYMLDGFFSEDELKEIASQIR